MRQHILSLDDLINIDQFDAGILPNSLAALSHKHGQHLQKIKSGKNITLVTLFYVAALLKTDAWKLLKP